MTLIARYNPTSILPVFYELDSNPVTYDWSDTPPVAAGSYLIRTDNNSLYYKSGEAESAWTVISSGGGGGGNAQRFLYVATGAEGSDFVVTLPAARANDDYTCDAACQGVTNIVDFDFPDVLVGDKTTTQFRCITTNVLTAGDVIAFTVEDLT